MGPYRLIAFDLDGTLLDSDKRLRPGVAGEIRRAVSAGCAVALATGRTRSELEPYREALLAVPLGILATGAILWDFRQERALWRRTFTPGQLLRLTEASRQEDILVLVKRDGGMLLEPDALPRWSRAENAKEVARFWAGADRTEDVRAWLSEGPEGVEKINFSHLSEEARERTFRRLEPLGFGLARSNRAVLEISPPGVTKGTALLRLCERLDIPAEASIAVGDADNDLPMLRACGLPVAMGNANARVKAAASAVVADCDHEGAAEAIRRFVTGFDGGPASAL